MTTKKPRVPRTRGGGKYSEAEYWSFIRSALRQKSRRWAPTYQCLQEARRPSKDKTNLRLKYQYQCKNCRKWFKQVDVSVDHIKPAGSLRCAEDLASFVTTLFCEIDNLQCLCHTCHKEKTSADKELGRHRKEV